MTWPVNRPARRGHDLRMTFLACASSDSFDRSLDVCRGIELLALPITAPWTTELGVAEFALRLAPKKVFPIHDGYAKDFFLASRYDNYGKYFAKEGIEFVRLEKAGAALDA